MEIKSKNKIKLIIPIWLVIIFHMGCDIGGPPFQLINNTEYELCYILVYDFFDCQDSILSINKVIETDFNETKSLPIQEKENLDYGVIKPKEIREIVLIGEWGGFIQRTCNKRAVLFTIKTVTVDSIKSNLICDSNFTYDRYVLTLKEIYADNYTFNITNQGEK